jgi:hypothetical protein
MYPLGRLKCRYGAGHTTVDNYSAPCRTRPSVFLPNFPDDMIETSSSREEEEGKTDDGDSVIPRRTGPR